MHELLSGNVSFGWFLSQKLTTIVFFARSRPGKKKNKHTTKTFVGFHNHSPLLTMLKQQGGSVKFLFVLCDRLGEGSSEKNCCW